RSIGNPGGEFQSTGCSEIERKRVSKTMFNGGQTQDSGSNRDVTSTHAAGFCNRKDRLGKKIRKPARRLGFEFWVLGLESRTRLDTPASFALLGSPSGGALLATPRSRKRLPYQP